MASTIRVDDDPHARLIALAAAENRPIGKIIEYAIHQCERDKFWQGVHEDYARLRSDPVAWKG